MERNAAEASKPEQVSPAEVRSRQRVEMATIAFTLTGGLIGNFVFSRVEVAAFLWLITLVALGDLICTFIPLPLNRRQRLAIVAVTLLVGVSLTFEWIWGQYGAQHAALVSGQLRASDCFPNVQDGQYFIEIGPGSGFSFDKDNHEPFNIMGDTLRFDTENSELKFSMTIRDREGNKIVGIDKNVWKIQPNLSWDHNYTSDSLEVLDLRGRVVLHVQLLKNGVRLNEESYSEQHGSIRLNDGSGPTSDPDFHKEALSKWFKYPSSQYWGQWAIHMPKPQ